MTQPLIETSPYFPYILSAWGFSLITLALMCTLPVLKHFQLRRQLARQIIRQNMRQQSHDSDTSKTS